MRSNKRSLRRVAGARRLAIRSGSNISRALRAFSGLLRLTVRRAISQPAPEAELRRAQLASEQALLTQRQVDTDKQRQLIAESKAKTWGMHVDTLRKVVPMVALAYGLAVSFLYFFLAIHFFPSGLSVGDTLLYVFIALGYGLVSMLFVGIGAMAEVPAEAYGAGRRAAGHAAGLHRSGMQWVVATLFAPVLLAWFMWLESRAYESWFGDHVWGLVVGLIVVSVAIGLVANARAWQEGAAMSAGHASRASADWIGFGVGHGFIFIAVYAFILLAYGLRAGPPLSVAVYAGFFAWLAFNLLGARKGEPARPVTRLESLRAGSGVYLASLGLLLAASPWFFHEAHPLRAVVMAGVGVIVYLIGIGLLPLSRIEELHGPVAPESRTADAAAPASAQSREASRRVSMAILMMAAFTVPLIADIVFLDFSVSTAVFRGLGLRADNASVRLKGESLSTVRAHARNAGVELSVCSEQDGSAIVAPITVLWHGMGKRSLLALGQLHQRESEKPRQGMSQVEVNSDELKLLQNQGNHCRDMKQEVFFRSGKVEAALATQERALAAEIEDVFLRVYPAPDEKHASNWRWVLERVLVSGHADPMPLGEAGNEGLARQRAACVAKELMKAIEKRGRHPFEDPDVHWDGEGARSLSKANCPLDGGHSALVECHAANRYAHVRMIFSCKDGSGKPFNGCEIAAAGPVDKYKPPPISSQQTAGHAARVATDAASECARASPGVDLTAPAQRP